MLRCRPTPVSTLVRSSRARTLQQSRPLLAAASGQNPHLTRSFSPAAGSGRRRRGRDLTPSPAPRHESKREFSSLATDPAATFLAGTNAAYVEEMFLTWRANPAAVHKSWDVYFRTGAYVPPPTLQADYTSSGPVSSSTSASSAGGISSAASLQAQGDAAKVVQLVRAYQVRGHFLANLDPLKLQKARLNHKELALSSYGFTDADLDRVIDLSVLVMPIKGFLDGDRKLTLREIYTRLNETYCGHIGYEYMHIPDVDKCNWIREQIETTNKRVLSKEEKLSIADRLTWADHFERFLATKYSSAKRFGLEGAETCIPGMKALITKAATLGVDSVVIGMPHRGRLNVLNSVIRKPLEQILSEFEEEHRDIDESSLQGSGDVKYHLGLSHTRKVNGNTIHLTLLANPSHLEAVNPVVCGKTRAKQFYKKDFDRSKVMGLLLHGDAAFSAQGVVYETLGMGDLPDYTTGGTIHIVVNNQIGFTTDPRVARSSPYCTDLAKAVSAPIFHVNGDDPEAVVRVCELAAEWRQRWKKDVVVDLVCYRKHGHNEVDEPSFTQPAMYKQIRGKKPPLQLYQEQLVAEGTATKQEIDAISDRVNAFLNEKFEASKTYKPSEKDWLEGSWHGLKSWKQYSPAQVTGVDIATLSDIGTKISTVPTGFNLHSRLQPIMKKKLESIKTKQGLDWATAEALSFGSLLLEGHHVRLSGQDVERGTFSHRHAVLHDQEPADGRDGLWTPLQQLAPNQAPFSISNSSLSEFGVLGFELGYSLESPKALVMWEAQFGDFANGAQVIIDQFLSSGEQKWLRQSGLTLLLPHGYEGNGPEHSSARMERFLQGSDDHPDELPDPTEPRQIQKGNWQVVNCSTPASYFHVLRRQVKRDFRKPLIIMTPKSLLRLPQCKSDLVEMGPNTMFKPVIEDDPRSLVADAKVRRVVFCSGRVYYDLLARRVRDNIKDVALVRVEQISPFPFFAVAAQIKKYKNAEVVWAQEEPMNMGAWTYVSPRMATSLRVSDRKSESPRYVGRSPSAATSTGLHSVHNKEQETLLKTTFAA